MPSGKMATNGEEPDQEISSDMIGECIVIKSCEPCTRKHTLSNATVFCKTCNEHLCDPCKNIHIIYKSGTHDTVAVEDLDMASVVVTMKGMDTCRDHDKKIKFFCEDHSKLCCNKCAFIHRKCDNVNELASLSSQEGLELQELLVNKTLLKLTTENFSIKTETEKALNETTANLPKQVDDMKDRIIDILDKSQKKIMVDADTFRAEEMKRIGERTEAFSRINTNINELIPFTSAVVKLGTSQQKYIATKVINETIKDMQTHITEHRSKHITSNVSVDFSKQLLFLLKGEESIVKLKVKRHFTHTDVVQSSTTNMQESSEVSNETTVLNKDVVQSSPTHVQESSEISNETTVLNKDAVQSSPTNIQESSEVSKETTVINKDVEQSSRTNTDLNQESSEVTKKTTVINKGNSNDDAQSARIKPVTMELLVSVELKQTGVDTEPFLSGIDFLPDGRLVAVDNKNRKCIIMNDMLQIQGTPYALNTYPYDVVCLSQCELAVTMSGKTVCLLYVSPNNVIRLTKKINTSTKVFSICCMTPSNMVVSTYGEYGHPLRMITQAGVESDLNHCKFPKKWYGYEESRCTYVPSKNTLVLTDKIAHTVYMYDIVKGTTIAVTNENIEYPRGACRGPGDTVLVCIGAMNSILHLTADGDILDTYQVDMTLPFSLCMAQDGSKLAVSSGNGHKKLMVYKLS